MSVCRTCFGTIKFVTVDAGRAIPVEPHPSHHRGNIAGRSNGRKITGYRITKDRPLEPGYLRYVPHYHPDAPRVLASERTPTLLDT